MNPPDLGLPARFSRWRPRQEEALYAASCADERFVAMVAPTGFGKSPVYLAEALMTGYRCCVITATKGLQDQLIREFEEAGLFDIRGRNNYDCRLDLEAANSWRHRTHPLRVDEGVCNWGQPCDYKAQGCEYFDRYRLAQRGNLIVTNYTYWLTINAFGDGLGKFDLLVLDEAHDAPDQLADFLRVEISHREIAEYGLGLPPWDSSKWHRWASPLALRVGQDAEELAKGLGPFGGRAAMKEAKHLAELSRRLLAVSSFKGAWVMDSDDERGYSWDPLWPAPYAEDFLFRSTPHVLLVSATIRPKTLGYLNVAQNGETGASGAAFLEYPSSFPLHRRPVWIVPTVRLNRGAGPLELGRWRSRVDAILATRMDRKGIVHTVSYKLRDYLLATSRFKHHMVTHNRQNTAEVVKQFKAAPAGSILVSPVMTTGWDFPYRECEYQIVGKLAFPHLGAKINQRRKETDKEWMAYVALMDLVQAAGRGMRAADDQCETFIIDDSIRYLWARHRMFTPRWFREAVRWSQTIPAPPRRLAA